MAIRALVVMALVAACGSSEAAKVCRGARTSAAKYLDVVGHMLATKTEVPPPVKMFEPPAPAADADTALWEAAIGELRRLQVELNDEMIATANAREALREPAKQSLKDTSATLLDDEADAVAAARTALDVFTKLDALDAALAKHADAVASKAAALRDRIDARLAQGIKDPEMRKQLSIVRTGVDHEVTVSQLMRTLDDRYAIDKLALNQVIADCGR